MGAEYLARPGDDPDCLDRRRGAAAARDPAQLGGLCAAPPPPRDADPGAAAVGVGEAAGFREPAPTAPLGSWTLLDPNTLLAAPHCTSAFPNGEVRFVEDRTGPPSRAYLKLWEALTLIGARPGPGDVCLDLGSSPGGWSWALKQMGARVISVDKAPLDPAVARLPGIEHRRDSAFALDPPRSGRWTGCFPMWSVIRRGCWRSSSAGSRPGPAGVSSARSNSRERPTMTSPRRFAAIPGSTLRHLFHNKHELTWIRLG